ncbi:MAG TPA: hypothetical protein PKH72_00120 [Rhodoferax sp.]|jgi:hypothetical protein|nr:hypothetical protein [Rhodoferax sp.]HNV58033.1 hypothetical protein [Rhodoferax sp.]
MATGNVIDTNAVKQAAEVFEEIATSAASIDRLCFNMSYADHDNIDALHSTIDIMRTLVRRIGWLGDLGCEKLKCGPGPVNGDAEHWMMSPVYVAELISAEVAHG